MESARFARIARYVARFIIIPIPCWILLLLCLELAAIDQLDWTTIAVSTFVGLVLTMVVEISYKLLSRKIQKAIPRAVLTSIILISAGYLWYLFFAMFVRFHMFFSLDFPWQVISIVGAWIVLAVPFGLRVFSRLLKQRARQHADRAFLLRQKVFSSSGNLSVLHLVSALDHAKQMLRNHADKTDEYLQFLVFLISIHSDSRFQRQVPLRIAASILDKFMKLQAMQHRGMITYGCSWSPASMNLHVRPALLYLLTSAFISYSLKTKKHAVLHVSSEAANDALLVRLATNISFEERAFQQAKDAKSIQLELDRAASELSRSVKQGIKLDRLRSDDGSLIYQLTIPQETIEHIEWSAIEQEFGPGLELLSDCKRSLGKNRVYRKGKLTLKVSRDGVPNQKPLSIEDEYLLLRSLRGQHGIPQVMGYGCGVGYQWMSYKHIDGTPLSEWIYKSGNARHWSRILADLSYIVQQLNANGVAYRDWEQPDNIIISKTGEVHLVDFDQAIMVLNGSKIDLLGLGDCTLGGASLKSLSLRLGFQEKDEKTHRLLNEAWKIATYSQASSPGTPIAYYALQFREWLFHGERPWYERWIPINAGLNEAFGAIKGKKVLALGCNMGLASAYLADLGAEVTGVDLEEDILESAKLVAKAFSVSPKFMQGNLCEESTFDKLENTYDLVLVMSVVRWLPNKEPILKYLSKQPLILYEGHGTESEDLQLLEACGFQKYRVLCYTNRLRPIILAEHIENAR